MSHEHNLGLIDENRPFVAGCTECDYWTQTREEFLASPVGILIAHTMGNQVVREAETIAKTVEL